MNSVKPLVSILIPNYNKAPYIRETLDSVLNQTYQHWECIIVDDHSTDESWEILEEYSAKDDRFRAFRRPDHLAKGGNVCRNYAIDLSTGRYIQFLDSDDIIVKIKLDEQVKRLENSDEIISISNWMFFNREKFPLLENDRWIDFPQEGLHLLLKLWNENKFIPSFSYLVRSSIIKPEIRWDEKLLQNQDGDFFCNVLLRCKSVIYEDLVLGFYRVPDVKNVSRIKSYETFTSVLESYIKYEERVLKVSKSQIVYEALSKNYLELLMRTIHNYPSIAEKSWYYLKNKPTRLGEIIRYPPLVKFMYLFGFKNTINIKATAGKFKRLLREL